MDTTTLEAPKNIIIPVSQEQNNELDRITKELDVTREQLLYGYLANILHLYL